MNPNTLTSILEELIHRTDSYQSNFPKPVCNDELERISQAHQKIEMLIPKEYYGIDLRFNEGWNAYREEMLKKLREGKNE